MNTVSAAFPKLALPDADAAGYDVPRVRCDFPVLQRTVYGRPLVYLDNAASSQKPRPVIEAMREAYETYYANVHRGVHKLSQQATDAFEAARTNVAEFVNAESADEIVFVRGATEAINLVAATYGRKFLREGDEVVISHMEHHSNIVPWQFLRDEKGVVLKVAPIDGEGNFLLDEYETLLSPRTKLVAITHVSNALGTVTPIEDIIRLAHDRGALILVDGCQSAPHMKIDVQALGADFYAFSSHKMYGPTGIGVLYGKRAILDEMPPYQGGGEMIESVTFEKTTFKNTPHRFEAGTPAIVEAIGLGAAVDFLESVGIDDVSAHESTLLEYATKRLSSIPGLTIYGTAGNKSPIVSFGMDGVHPHDIGTVLDRAGVAIRAGHHCAQPLMDRLGVAATARASFAMYNTREEVDVLVEAVAIVRELFS